MGGWVGNDNHDQSLNIIIKLPSGGVHRVGEDLSLNKRSGETPSIDGYDHVSDDFENGDGHKVADDENNSEGREIVTKLGDEHADSRLLFNFGDLGGDLVIVIEKIQLSFPFPGRSISPGSIAHFSVFLSGDIVVDAVYHLLQLLVLSKVARRPFRLRAGSVVRVAVSKIGSILSKSPRHLVF